MWAKSFGYGMMPLYMSKKQREDNSSSCYICLHLSSLFSVKNIQKGLNQIF